MQTQLADFIKDTPDGRTAEKILRTCVHCGFCNATCPTYQLLGDELDGPRGRIYLIKQVLEGAPATAKTQLHLDRCLTCRNCETTCPSGVEYGKLVDIGRAVVERQVTRPTAERAKRDALMYFIPRSNVFGPLLKLGQSFKPWLPKPLRDKVPQRQDAGVWPAARHARRMVVLQGCAQPALAPDINAAAARVLDRLGISLVSAADAGCCGALRFHLNEQDAGLDDMRRNVDAWGRQMDAGVEAVVMTASGCGVMVKDYVHLLEGDARYAEKARRISAATLDLAEVLERELERLPALMDAAKPAPKVAFHPPCTLQHGQKMPGIVERILKACGYPLLPFAEAHLCCGSAGTYSILQPELATRLRERKLGHLHAAQPDVIASANIGCLTHLQGGTEVPVKHWIELLAARLKRAG